MPIITASLIALGGIGILAAIILYIVARRFNVPEDPLVGQIEALLPGANCGGCGFSGCHDFASRCAASPTLDGFTCPGADADAMSKIASIKGVAPTSAIPKIAVLRCNGTCANRPVRATYDGVQSCALLSMIAVGSTDCAYGCLGCGDCVKACHWDAIHIGPTTGLPAVADDRCVGCGLCASACPRSLLELRNKGPRGLRVWVACSNREKGAIARNECRMSCIGCGKCARTCPHGAITVADDLAYIDFAKCKLCRKCIPVCPTGAILSANFPSPIIPS